MALRDWLPWGRNTTTHPAASTQPLGGGVMVSTPAELEQAMLGDGMSGAGLSVTPESAMRVAVVYACVRIIAGAVANLPLHVMRRLDANVREDASDHWLWDLLRRKPNGWQTPSAFRRMMQAHLLLRGNAYALIVRSRGRVINLLPLDPDRMKVSQGDNLALGYEYTRKDGRRIRLMQGEVMHLVGLTLDGVVGVSAIRYARETIGLAMAMEAHGTATFKNGARPSNVLVHPQTLGPEGRENLRASLDDYRAGGESEGKALILEEDMKVLPLSMTAEDAQWIESRKFSRSDIAMFFGVPPHMIGDTEKSTSWGTGIEQQSSGFVTYSLEDHLTTWEETINRDLISDSDNDIYARFNRNALVRGDLKARTAHYATMAQWGILSPNDIRALEDLNPREGGEIYYPPPNTAGEPEGKEDDDPKPS